MDSLFSAPLELRSVPVGGGRGVFATQKIAAGTVLLTEEALLEVPEEAPEGHTLHTALAQQLLRRKGVDEAESRVFGYLHPQRLSDMPEGDLAACREKWGDVAGKLAAEAGCGEDEALQAVLKMQFNALRSGVYTRIAMVNHACLPSCAAFGHKGEGKGGKSWCEIVAVRDIDAGEEITITYLAPPEQSFLSRRSALLEQHLFALESSTFPAEMDPVAEGEEGAAKAEAIRKLEERLAHVEQVVGHVGPEDRLDELSEVEEELSDLCEPLHVALVRCRRAQVETCLEILQESGNAELAATVLEACLQITKAQDLYLPKDHCDRASVLTDAMGALEFLIDSLPDSMDALETSGMPDMTSSGAVSRRAAHMQRVGRKALQQWAKEARRVRGLYDAGTRKGAVGMQEGFLKRGGERDGEGSKGDAAWGLFE